jgi:hypothetical protein
MHLAGEQNGIHRGAEIVDDGVVHDLVPPVSGSISTSQICVPLG